MQSIAIIGGRPLMGEVWVQGAKNSVLPLLAAALVSGDTVTLEHCPRLRDVTAALDILTHLGCRVRQEEHVITLDTTALTRADIPDDLMTRMRSSVIFLGAILARNGHAELSYPGGCALGARPIDLHLRALEELGYTVELEGSRIQCRAGSLHGARICFPFPSVGATENAMLAALACPGETILEGAAREPEIQELARFLTALGAQVSGAGSSRIVVQGQPRLHAADFRIMPDRIVAATWLSMAAATGGSITLRDARAGDLLAVLDVFREAGCQVRTGPDHITLSAPRRLKAPGPIRTSPYPGFPTDAQPPVMAALLKARGETVFEETIFENRYRHLESFAQMGAEIRLEGQVARITGVSALSGAHMTARDLRGGAALVTAALSARGVSLLDGMEHVQRGYEDLEGTILSLGGAIKRLDIP